MYEKLSKMYKLYTLLGWFEWKISNIMSKVGVTIEKCKVDTIFNM